MPCIYHESEEEREAARKRQVDNLLAPYRRNLNSLTKENDFLRELVLVLADGGELSPTQRKHVEEAQVAHRREDLQRLRETFKAKGDFDRFESVVKADPTKPLEPQLGFGPDDF